MDAKEFDRLTRVHLIGASRRGVVARLGRGLVAALSLAPIGSASIDEADARGKGEKHKKHKKQRKQGGAGTTTPTDPVNSTGPTSPPPSLPAGPGFCNPNSIALRSTN